MNFMVNCVQCKREDCLEVYDSDIKGQFLYEKARCKYCKTLQEIIWKYQDTRYMKFKDSGEKIDEISKIQTLGELM
jgi:hypothetical protein